MANLDGFDGKSVGNMLNHYTRHAGDPNQEKYTYKNQKIDPTRTHLNFAVFERSNPKEFIDALITSCDIPPRVGKNATNVMSDWIVTMPKNELLQGREHEFFEETYRVLIKRIPKHLVVGAWVHMDETWPHMHFAFVSLVESPRMTNDKTRPKLDSHGVQKRDKKGTLKWERVPLRDERGDVVMMRSISQTKMFDRKAMREFHPWLESELEQHFGFKTGIMLDDPGEKLLSNLNQPEYKQAKASIKAANEEKQRAEQAADEQLGVFVEATSQATKAAAERDALKEEVAALHGELRQAVEAAKAARAAQEKAEQARDSAREAADLAGRELTAANNKLADTRAAVDGARDELAAAQADTAAEVERLAATKAAADAEARRLECVRRDGIAADGRINELKAAIAAQRCRIESESRIASALDAEGAGSRGAAERIAAAVERGSDEAERAESRAGELEREAQGERIDVARLDEQCEQWRAAGRRADSEAERRVGRRTGEIDQGRAELRRRVAAARARFAALVEQARERIEGGLTAATERLYNAARKALRMVSGALPDTRLADGLTAAYEAADAAVKPEMTARAAAYRRNLRHALAEYEVTAKAAEGTKWRRFPKASLPKMPEIVGSSAKAAADDRKRAARRADALRRRYASGVPDDDGDAYGRRGGDDGPARGREESRNQSRSRSR